MSTLVLKVSWTFSDEVGSREEHYRLENESPIYRDKWDECEQTIRENLGIMVDEITDFEETIH